MHHILTKAEPAVMTRALDLLATFETKHVMLEASSSTSPTGRAR